MIAVPGVVLAWCADNGRHASAVLAARLPGVPSLGDLTRVDWAVVPPAGLVTAGFPASGVVPRQAAGALRLLIQPAAACPCDPGLTGQDREAAA